MNLNNNYKGYMEGLDGGKKKVIMKLYYNHKI